MESLASRGDGLKSALDRTADADSLLRRLMWKHRGRADGLAILAVGGYGRGDNTLRSDLDIILLFSGNTAPHETALRHLVQNLWDHGWSPAQSLLDINEIDSDLLAIPDRASALLEARFVWGDRNLAAMFDQRLCRLFQQKVWERFIELKHDEFEVRRRKYGNVVRVVEPHLKSQAGGLRDLHHVFWIGQARLALDGKWRMRRKRIASIRSFIIRLKGATLLRGNEVQDLLDAYDTMLRVREALRRLNQREEDLLTVSQQPMIGRLIGLDGSDDEVICKLMRTVCHAMERLARFSEEFGAVLTEYGVGRVTDMSVFPAFAGVRRAGERIYIEQKKADNIISNPEQVLKLVDSCIRQGVMLSGGSSHLLRHEMISTWKNRNDTIAWAKPIRKWFNLSRGVGKRLRRLAELEGVEPWLPEWGEIAGLTSGSYYHTYTVDEHTLRALEELDRLPGRGPEGLPRSLWKDYVEGRPLVYAAVMLHDIAKSRSGDHSLVGAGMAVEALDRLEWSDLAEPVARLVRMHLYMEQVAFRRDSSDPEVVSQFAKRVGDLEMLKALYLLTVCDLRAVRSGVWTTWKGQLLAELYIAVRNWFREGEVKLEPLVTEHVRQVASLVENGCEAENRARRFLEAMQAEYRRAVPQDEIAGHLEAVEQIEAGEECRWLIRQESGFVTITLITRDFTGLLARIVGLLVSQGIGIREARIFTRDDGIVVDRFRAEDNELNGVPINERLNRIPQLWEKLTGGELQLERLLEGRRRRRKLIRQPVALVETEAKITPAEKGWLVDISGPDRVGLLLSLCNVLVSTGLDVRAARVTGRLDGIHDAFLVHDPEGVLSDPEGRKILEGRIKEVVDEKE